MSTADEALLKKRNQRRDDIRVYVTMVTIVVIAALVTISKILVVKYYGLQIESFLYGGNEKMNKKEH